MQLYPNYVELASEAASKIDTIVELINSNAGQPNLLALNHEIEAAQAEEAGKCSRVD
ncbi:methyl-accepting chemotaxis protein [Roseibium album]|uniref:methyl-accepting chemotaxis protein n=1 Tax=Roseibium album TaxID=311410 RepID=UPI003CD0C92B